MKKAILLFLTSIIVSSAYADIPYCPGTKVTEGKHDALQYVVTTFARENNCEIGNNCLLNFDRIKYSIAWSKDCEDSARRNNDPKGSTFICDKGFCYPYGFEDPVASYKE